MTPQAYPASNFGIQAPTSARPLVDKEVHDYSFVPPACATGTLFLILLAGTGTNTMNPAGTAAAARAIPVPTNVGCQILGISQRRRDDDWPLGTAEKLTFIQDQFSLSISSLAAVLRISRPALYAWLREEAVPHVQKLRRIDELVALARLWRELSASPIGQAGGRPISIRQPSVIELLSQEVLDREALASAFRVTAPLLEADRMPRRGRTPITTELRRRHGFPELTEAERTSPEDLDV